jgi:SET domain
VLPPPRCYVNHSCVPNAVSTSDTVYARRDITAGEEITVDYRLNAYDDGDVWEMVCRCEMAPAGHLVRGDFFSLPADVQKEYLSEAPPFIQQMYRERHTRLPS